MMDWWMYVTGARGGSGTDEAPFIPQVKLDYPDVACRDMSNTPAENIPPDPNVCVAYVRCSLATADLINDDPNYVVTSQGAL